MRNRYTGPSMSARPTWDQLLSRSPRPQTAPAAARDSVQLHLAFGSRDRDPAARRGGLGAARRAARASGAPADRHACCTRCWATSGSWTAIPFLQDDLIDNPKRRGPAHRGPAPSAARGGEAPRSGGRSAARPRSRSCCRPPARPWIASSAHFPDIIALRKRARRALLKHTRADNVHFDALCPGRARHGRDRLARGAAVRWCSRRTPRRRFRALVRDCIELGLTVIPRGGGTGYTGGAVPLTPWSAVINTEKLEGLGAIERTPLAGHGSPRAPIAVHARRASSPGASARPRSARASCSRSIRPRPTPCCIGGNIAMNAGGKKAVLWGTAVDNLAWWRMVDPQATGSK